ncbi:unnamed protein product [Trichobilharzia szidati]|nr:unnamed protein product [Trichobilharzia szidati]
MTSVRYFGDTATLPNRENKALKYRHNGAVEHSGDSSSAVEDDCSATSAADVDGFTALEVPEKHSDVDDVSDSPPDVDVDSTSATGDFNVKECVSEKVAEKHSNVDDASDSPPDVDVDSTSVTGDFNVKECVSEKVVEKHSNILPLDLIDSESSDDDHDEYQADASPPLNQADDDDESEEDAEQFIKGEEEQEEEEGAAAEDDEETEEQVGRWTYSSGAAKKKSKTISKSKTSAGSKPGSSSLEEERLQIHIETQRLVREADIRLPVHRPKQFKCFSEFRQSLKGITGSESKGCESSSQTTSLPDCCSETQANSEQQPTQCDPVECKTLDIKPSISHDDPIDNPPLQSVDMDCSIAEPTPSTSSSVEIKPKLPLISESDKLMNILPSLSTRSLFNDNNEEFYIDLGESISSSSSSSKPRITPADQLLARLKKHLTVSHEKVVPESVEYSIITKVQTNDNDREELQVETVTHRTSTSSSSVLSTSRKKWLEHRKLLEEKMRQKRLQQYEARLKEEGLCGSKKSTNENTEEASNSDEEWSEGDDEAEGSELSEDSSSTDDEEERSGGDDEEEEEEEGEEEEAEEDENADEDDDDVVNVKSSKRRVCLFADDEAEESETDDDDNDDDDGDDDESGSETMSTFKHSLNLKAKDLYNKKISIHDGDIDKFGSLRKQPTEFDDYTDLPETKTGFADFSSCNANFSFLHPQRRQQGSLGPGDVDLFATECSSILDKTMNPRSMLASTRLDTTTVGDENKSRLSRDSSSHSQWNNTPYELLYSQRPNSQLLLASRSESPNQESIDDNLTLLSGNNINHISSQDTVLLSQEPTQPVCDLDPTLILSQEKSMSVHSQIEHEKRRDLFGGSVSDQSEVFTDSASKTTEKQNISHPDSQIHHEHRRNLFGGSLCDDDQSREFTDLITDESVKENDTSDSQVQHEDRCNLFAGSLCNPSEDVINNETDPLERNDTSDSQALHEDRYNLFGGSISSRQSEASRPETVKSIDNSDSQIQHDNRHNLFAGSLYNRTQEFIDETTKQNGENDNSDSQANHENRHNLFGGSLCDQSQAFMDSTTEPVLNNNNNNNTDSQVDHANRRNLFIGSLCDEQYMDSTIKPVDIDHNNNNNDMSHSDSQIHHDNRRHLFTGSLSGDHQSQSLMDSTDQSVNPDSQIQHDNRHNLFAGSLCDQTQAFIDETTKPNGENDNSDTHKDHENDCNLFGDQSEVFMDLITKPNIKNDNQPDPQDSSLPSSMPSTQSSSRRRVLILDDDDDDNEEQQQQGVEKGEKTAKNSNPKEGTIEDDDNEKLNADDSEDEGDEASDNSDGTISAKEDSEVEEADEEEGEEEEEEDTVADDDDEEEVQRRLTLNSTEVTKKKKKFRVNDFVDEEAELSGDENERAYYMDDEDELNVNDDDDDDEELADLIDENDADIPSSGRLRRQVERVHHRLQTDQDLREIRILKELYLEDGDLHTEDGRVRQRRFRWRGLDNDDPFADQLNMDDDDDDGDGSSNDEGDVPYGPMDRWLRGPLGSKLNSSSGQNNTDNDQSMENVDLDSDGIQKKSKDNPNDEDTLPGSDNDDDDDNNNNDNKENLQNNIDSNTVLSLGRKALMKTQTKMQTQIIVKNKISANRGKTTKSCHVVKNASISNFLKPKLTTSESTTTKTTNTTSIKNDKHISKDDIVDAGDDDDDNDYDDKTKDNNNTCKSVDFIKPILDTDNNTRDVKLPVVRRGSLLSRPTGSFLPGFKSELPKKALSFTEDFDTDPPTNSNTHNNNNSNNNQNNRRGNHAHLLGLRNKVGLSCFSVATPNVKSEKSDPSFDNNVDSGSNQSAVQGSSKNTTMKHKRSMDMIKPHSALLSPPSLKRHRSSSVFTALL